jgi:DNA topoisomerase IB
MNRLSTRQKLPNNISKRAGDLYHLSGVTEEIANKIRNLPGYEKESRTEDLYFCGEIEVDTEEDILIDIIWSLGLGKNPDKLNRFKVYIALRSGGSGVEYAYSEFDTLEKAYEFLKRNLESEQLMDKAKEDAARLEKERVDTIRSTFEVVSMKNLLSKRAGVKSDKPAYKEKEKGESGKDIYRYTEEHIKKRWDLKKEKLKKLEKDIDKVRKQYREDLKSDDDRTKAIAAIVGIMDDTAMRIGNEESAKEGTYGATTLKVKHVKGGSGKMTFDFPGKGAIEQNVVLENNEVIKAVRDLMKGKKKDDFIFEVDGKKIWDRAVNRYLKPLGISAKDLRGFHSNRLMKETLKKKDWKDALEEVSEIVGHEANTLKNQYLDPELVEKHENKEKDKKDKDKKNDKKDDKKDDKKKDKKKKAYISIRAIEQTPTIEKTIKEVVQKPEYGAGTITMQGDPPAPTPKPALEPEKVEEDFTKMVDINKNVGNIRGDIGNYPNLQTAWRVLAPFLPDGAMLSSGWRSDNEQAKIIIEFWLSAVWPGKWKRLSWKRDQGFFLTNFEGPSKDALNWWLRKAKSPAPVTGRLYKLMSRDLEPLRKIMTTYSPKGIENEPPERLQIASLGTSRHLQGLAMDISGASLRKITEAATYINNRFGDVFAKILPERGQKAVHVVIQQDLPAISQNEIVKALLDFEGKNIKVSSISKRSLLKPQDEELVSQLEQKYFGKATEQPNVSRIVPKGPGWVKEEDVFRLGKNKLNIGQRVKLTNDIISAWVLLKPHLPKSAVITSGVRTPEDQVRIINNYWKKSKLYIKYPNVTDPYDRSKLLIKNGWIVGPPTRKDKKPIHGSGRVFDISGADLREIASAAKKVSSNPSIPVTFSQVLLEEKNNAVHIGIRNTVPLSELLDKVRRTASPTMLSKRAIESVEEDTKEQVSSIFEDLLNSNPPKEVVEEYRSAFGDMMTKAALDLGDMGFGVEDEMGDWWEKNPIFRHREEVPEYDIDAEKSEASKLAKDDPEEFFYRGLHKEYDDLEVVALKNIIEDNPKFYFLFKYHKREEPKFIELKQRAAEVLSQKDPRAFFYYDLHREMPELGRGAILQLIDKDPRSFGQLGLDKDYPDYIESATNAINIYDPTKTDIGHPNRNAGRLISKRAADQELILPISEEERNRLLQEARSFQTSNKDLEEIYELEYKLHSLSQRDYLTDSTLTAATKMKSRLNFLLDRCLEYMKDLYIVWLTGHEDRLTVPPQFEKDLQSSRETYKRVFKIYKMLETEKPTETKEKMALFSIALNTHHSTGKMGGELHGKWSDSLLNELSSGEKYIPKWDEELSRMASKSISKRAINPEFMDDTTDVETKPSLNDIPKAEEIEKSYRELGERVKKEYDPNVFPMDEDFDWQVDIRKPSPSDVVRYFMFKHHKRDKYKPYNKEMLSKLLSIQPSKFFDANLFSEEEFYPYSLWAVESVAKLEPQYFIEYLAWSLPKESVGRYLEIARESLKEDKTLEERRRELLGEEPMSEEEYKKTLVPPEQRKMSSLISKRAGAYGWWLSPDKKLYEVGEEAHYDFLSKNPELFDGQEEGDLYTGAYAHDWIRIVNGPNALIFEFPDRDDKYISRVQSVLDQLPEKRDVEISWGYGRWIHVPYSAFIGAYGFRDLEKMRNASISKRDRLSTNKTTFILRDKEDNSNNISKKRG